MNQQPWTVERILQTTGAYWASCALHGAVALDVFTCIGDQWSAGKSLARQLNVAEAFLLARMEKIAFLGFQGGVFPYPL